MNLRSGNRGKVTKGGREPGAPGHSFAHVERSHGLTSTRSDGSLAPAPVRGSAGREARAFSAACCLYAALWVAAGYDLIALVA